MYIKTESAKCAGDYNLLFLTQDSLPIITFRTTGIKLMNKLKLMVLLSAFITGPTFAYDKGLAKNFEQYFSTFTGANAGKSMQFISAKSLVEGQKKGDNLFVLDIRTPGETSFYGFNITNSLTVPMNEVFKANNLKKIPTNLKVVVVCKAGGRATAVATGLRNIGFKNVYVLKKGFAELAKYVSPKTAY